MSSNEQTQDSLAVFGTDTEVGPVSGQIPSPGFTLPRQWLGLVLPLLIVVIWELLSRAGFLAANWFPAPFTIAETLLELLRGGDLVRHITYTLVRVLAGFLIGAFSATILAGITGSTPLARQLLDPTIQALAAYHQWPGCRCFCSGWAYMKVLK